MRDDIEFRYWQTDVSQTPTPRAKVSKIFNGHLVSTSNNNVLLFTNQGYSRLIDLRTMVENALPDVAFVKRKKK